MNLTKLFDTQRILDAQIMEKHPELVGQNNLDWKILALQVELGECANEWRGFKKWSTRQSPSDEIFISCIDDEAEYFFCGVCHEEFSPSYAKTNEYQCLKDLNHLMGMKKTNPLLEEYVDCLHFILSIGLELECTPIAIDVIRKVSDSNIVNQFNTLFTEIPKVLHNISFLNQELPETMRYSTERLIKTNYHLSFSLFIGLGEMLGFTWEHIEEAYYEKNEINHIRQSEGY